MDAEEYSKQASKSFNRKLPPIQVLTNASMGCAGEAGEFVDHIKKVAFHGHDLDVAHVIKELGDQLWYINYAIYALNLLGHSVTLSDVMQENTDKLEARYPNGFSSEASRNRITEAPATVAEIDKPFAQANSIVKGTYGGHAQLKGIELDVAIYFLSVDWPRANNRLIVQLRDAGYDASIRKDISDGALYLRLCRAPKATAL